MPFALSAWARSFSPGFHEAVAIGPCRSSLTRLGFLSVGHFIVGIDRDDQSVVELVPCITALGLLDPVRVKSLVSALP